MCWLGYLEWVPNHGYMSDFISIASIGPARVEQGGNATLPPMTGTKVQRGIFHAALWTLEKAIRESVQN